MRVLVTGGSGFLGGHLLEALSERGDDEVRVLCHRGRPRWPGGARAEVVEGDVLDEPSLREALSGVDVVYHLAGLVSRSPSLRREMYAIHVDGTRNLMRAARAAGVSRVLLCSTSGTVAVSEEPEPVPDEAAPEPLAIIARWPYYASKLYQERAALAAAAEGGPEVVVANPSLLLGPGDEKLSSTRDVASFLQRDLPGVPPGGLSFIDARDAARGLVLAAEKGRPGARYLMGAANWSFTRFFGRLERMTKVPAPRLRLPARLARRGARALEVIFDHLDRVPPVEPASLEMGSYYWYLDDSRARRELGLETRDPQETLLDTVRYLEEHVLGRGAFAP